MSFDNPRASIDLGESDEAFTRRRAAEERLKIAETSCMVRSVHEELLETYQDRAVASAGDAAAIDALLHRIDDATASPPEV
jgi:hypothetical protein